MYNFFNNKTVSYIHRERDRCANQLERIREGCKYTLSPKIVSMYNVEAMKKLKDEVRGK